MEKPTRSHGGACRGLPKVFLAERREIWVSHGSRCFSCCWSIRSTSEPRARVLPCCCDRPAPRAGTFGGILLWLWLWLWRRQRDGHRRRVCIGWTGQHRNRGRHCGRPLRFGRRHARCHVTSLHGNWAGDGARDGDGDGLRGHERGHRRCSGSSRGRWAREQSGREWGKQQRQQQQQQLATEVWLERCPASAAANGEPCP